MVNMVFEESDVNTVHTQKIFPSTNKKKASMSNSVGNRISVCHK